MSKPLTVTRADHMAAELRLAAGKCRDPAQLRRLLALALVLEGRSRTEAAEQSGMQRQTLRLGRSASKGCTATTLRASSA